MAALAEMNRPAPAPERDDGYVQDEASQWVAALVEVGAGDRVGDLCAAPGGKTTAMAGSSGRPSLVVAGDVHDEFKRIDILVNALSAQSSVQRQGASLRRLHGSVVVGGPP